MMNLDLEAVDSPEDLIQVLRAAAQAYIETGEELADAHQDRGPAQLWAAIAKELEKAANKVEHIAFVTGVV